MTCRKSLYSMPSRRALLEALLAGLGRAVRGWTRAAAGPAVLSGGRIDLAIGHAMVGGQTGHGVLVDGSLPAPLIRLREGQRVPLAVRNDLPDEDTSLHWHSLPVPFQHDGVPGVSFPGIRPGVCATKWHASSRRMSASVSNASWRAPRPSPEQLEMTPARPGSCWA